MKRAARDAMDYLEGLDKRPVAATPEAIAALNALRGPLPPGPTSAETVLHLLDTYGSPATMAQAGGRDPAKLDDAIGAARGAILAALAS